ncbi:target of Myb protein 1 isoform X1 [Phalaenopsis equestris]|uniref:target of Myb protein 1 isoform X1 n=1 Tax=Phalaenopsis equestris TaxID=78828 RepID=UPI0009E20BB6|nr:target of Myb protein 1 isoform X1 [Phalaenopsis equestris]
MLSYQTDMEVRDKILVLLDSWQEAFGGSGGKYPQYFWAYTDLKRSGVEFPHHPSDATLLFTSPTHQAAIARTPYIGHGVPSDLPMRLDQAMASEIANLSLSDLDRIRSVMELLNDMLKAVNPHDREAVEDEIIKELVGQCRSNQKKILQLIESTGDEEILAEGLALNDTLQTLLAKHDSIASGSPFPEESSEFIPVSSPPIASATIAANSFEEDEEEDDEFTQLARRNLKSKSTSTEINATTAGKQSSDEASSSTGSHSLALPDPPPPIKTSAKDQNIIDLLRMTLSLNSSPSHTPITPHAPSPTFQPNGSADPFATNVHGNPQSPQTHPMPSNSYAAGWAAAPPSSLPQSQPSSSPPQPQFLFRPEQQPQYSNYPPPPWEDVPSTNPNPFAQSTYMMEYNSVGMNAGKPPVVAGEARPNSNHRPTVPGGSHKPFVPSYRLFEELVDSSNSPGAPKHSSTSGQGMGYSGK